MTPAQRTRFYFPAWSDTCRALGWRMDRGRLVVDEARLNDHGRKVLVAAQTLAGKEQRAVTLDDLRYGAHIVSLGWPKSSAKFSNKEVDRVVSFFKLLQDDTNIAASMRLNNPAIAEREALVARIGKMNVPFAIIDGACEKAFAPVYVKPFFEDLPIASLRALVGILTEIQEREHEKVEQPF